MKNLSLKDLLNFDVAEELGIEDPKEKDSFYQEYSGILLGRVVEKAQESLSEEDQKELLGMFEKEASPEKVFSFLNTKVENFLELVGRELLELKEESLRALEVEEL